MELTQLEAGMLHHAIVHACYRVTEHRSTLNAINVFPVADGDTGDNMAATAKAIIVHSGIKPTLYETLQSIADASIMGARGNSGMIFSQFFNGLCTHHVYSEHLNTQSFAALVQQAVISVRQAILNPVEGTILDVLDAWAAALNIACEQTGDFNELLELSFSQVEEALQKTTEHLSVLIQANVVDAGALGFYHFIDGFKAYLANPAQAVMIHSDIEEHDHEHEVLTAGEPPVLRYCTEAILVGDHLDKNHISAQLTKHGDSQVSTGNERLCRFHLHTNEPWNVFDDLELLGAIQQPKVDDMLRQYQSLHDRKSSIALVTDSSADLPQAFLDEHQIHLIPLNLHIDDHHLLDKYCMHSEQLYKKLASLKQHPGTSFPPPALMRDKLLHLADLYDDVIVISIAQSLSGTHDALVKAAEGQNNIHVINSRLASAAQGLFVAEAAHMIAAGDTVKMIKNQLNNLSSKIHFYVMVYQMDSMIRSGRVSRLKGMIAQLSGVKPIITLDDSGKGTIHDKAFSETRALCKLIEATQKATKGSGMKRYCIVHAGAREKAEEFAKLTTEAFGKAPEFIESVSTVIGLHAGQGCVGLAALSN